MPEGDKMIGTKKQWLAFYKKEKPVMADHIVGRAPREVLIRHFGDGVQKTTVVEGAYKADGYSLPLHL